MCLKLRNRKMTFLKWLSIGKKTTVFKKCFESCIFRLFAANFGLLMFREDHMEIMEKKKFKPKFNKFKPKSNEIKLESIELTEEQTKKYIRGKAQKFNSQFRKPKFQHRQEKKFKYAAEQSTRAEILLNEEDGYIIPDEGEETVEYTQNDIKKNVDITSATKSFKLNLDFGPYKLNFTKNGRNLVLGGRKGHVAAFDWISKKLHCEFNVMEEIFDIKWLHLETMFAVAQKKWVHFYDNKGTEIHCVKKMHNVNQLEFLPYHFLLASGSDDGWLKWLDVSIGEMVAEFKSLDDKISIMKQNPSTGVINVGSSKGVVSMWTPAQKEPLARVLCHEASITALAFNPSGSLMATTGIDRTIKLWDSRMLKLPVLQQKANSIVNNIALSQRNVLAVSLKNECQIFKNVKTGNIVSASPYLKQIESASITSLEFAPYEDVLGIGSENAFTSILVPGAGESNFDTMEQNIFRTKKQRREHEVKALLEKIPHELITLDSSLITDVDVDTFQEKLEAKPNVVIPITTLNEKKQKSGIEKSKRKQVFDQQKKLHLLKAAKLEELKERKKSKKKIESESSNALDRFKRNKK